MRKLSIVGLLAALICSTTSAADRQSKNDFLPISFSAVSGLISRDITITGDSIVGVINDSGFITTERMDFIGNKLIVTTVGDLSTATAVYDLDQGNEFVRNNPEVVQQFEQSTNVVSKLQSRLNTHGPMPAAAGSCIAEANAMMDAADAAIIACAGGGGLACSLATINYGKKKDAYLDCVKAMSASSQ